jgi:hypothetical protein
MAAVVPAAVCCCFQLPACICTCTASCVQLISEPLLVLPLQHTASSSTATAHPAASSFATAATLQVLWRHRVTCASIQGPWH